MLPPGATYLPDFIAPRAEEALVAAIDRRPWITELRRRVQHYGYRYDYRARQILPESYLGDLPGWLLAIAQQLTRERWFDAGPDQAITNEYQPGQGIAAHVDCMPCFGDTIVSISLLSACEMQFRNQRGGEAVKLMLEPRSAIILQGKARYEWTHAIAARKSDVVDGERIQRKRRLSLTFRKVIADHLSSRQQ